MNSRSAYPPLTSDDAAMVLDALTDSNPADTTSVRPDTYCDEPNVEREDKNEMAHWESLQAQLRAHIHMETMDNLPHLHWKGLVNDVQSRLLAMSLEQRRAKAQDLIMLAQSGVGDRFHYLFHAMATLVSVQHGMELLQSKHPPHTPNAFSFIPVVSLGNEPSHAPTNCHPYPPLPPLERDPFARTIMETKSDLTRTGKVPSSSAVKPSSSKSCKRSSSKSTKVSASKKSESKSKKSTHVPPRRSSRLNSVLSQGGGVDEVCKLDVISGRGGKSNSHEGNKRFRDEARKLRNVYETVRREEKRGVSMELVERVKAYGGKFLVKGDDGLWYEMEDEAARKKASQALRELKWVNQSAA